MTDDEKPTAQILHFPQKIPEPLRSTMREINTRMMTMMREYKLVGHKAVLITDPDEIGSSFYERHRIIEETGEDPYRVAFDDLGGGVSVSTVFLSIDHNHFWRSNNGPPLIFETMVFGDTMLDLECERCSTWEQAEQQHIRMVALVRAASTG